MGYIDPVFTWIFMGSLCLAALHCKLFFLGDEFSRRRYWCRVITALEACMGWFWTFEELQRYVDYGTVYPPNFVFGVSLVVLSLVVMHLKVKDINREERRLMRVGDLVPAG